MSMKHLLIATSVLALSLGGAAFAQTSTGSPTPDNSPASSDSNMPANSSGANMNGGGANGGPMASNAPSMSTSGIASRSGASASPDEIKQAQQALTTQGLYRGQLDGKWGPETRQAVAQFQKTKGLKQTAQLDPQTMNDLQSGAMSGSDNMSSAPNASTPANPSGDATRGNGPAASGSNPGGENSPTVSH